MTTIYKQHDSAFANVSAFIIATKGGKSVGKVAFKHGNRVTCFFHIGGTRMTKGWADGGGYDKATAAAESAVDAIDLGGAYPDTLRHVQRIRKAMSKMEGYSWERRLQDAGYQVLQAV